VLGERGGEALDVGLVGTVSRVVEAGAAELAQRVAGGERREGEAQEYGCGNHSDQVARGHGHAGGRRRGRGSGGWRSESTADGCIGGRQG
jgi:hypothetical protein